MNEFSGNIQILPIKVYKPRTDKVSPRGLEGFVDGMGHGSPSLLEWEIRYKSLAELSAQLAEVLEDHKYRITPTASVEVFAPGHETSSNNMFTIIRGVKQTAKAELLKVSLPKILGPLFRQEASGIAPEVNLALGRAVNQIGRNVVAHWVGGYSDPESDHKIASACSPWLNRIYSGPLRGME